MQVTAVSPLLLPAVQGPAAPSTTDGADDFAGHLLDAIDQARSSEAHAEELAQRFADGDPSVGIHEVMIASERAQIGLSYAVTLKNKAIEAYRELMSTPL